MSSRVVDAWDDDWENEDYARGGPPAPSGSGSANADGRDAAAADNARLWQIANTSLSFGPQTTSTGAGNARSNHAYAYDASGPSPAMPPPQAYMPSLKILKRPTSAAANRASSSAASSAAAQAKSLKDREKAYQEARRKIFGESEMAAINAPLPASPALSPGQSPDVSEGEQQQLPQSGQQQQQSIPAKQGRDGSRAGKKGTGNGRGDSRQRKGAPPPPSAPAAGTSAGSLSVPGSSHNTPPVSSRPSTPLALASVAGGPSLIREPLNPPSANSQTGHVPRGFTNTRKPPKVQKNLSPAAQAFVPRGLVPAKVADKQIQTRQPVESQASQPTTLQEGMSRLAV